MQKPDITIYDVSTGVQERPLSATTTIITTLTFSFRMGDETYDTLTVSGEGIRYEDSLRDAVDAIDWTIYLDAIFNDDEIAILRAANLAYEADHTGCMDERKSTCRTSTGQCDARVLNRHRLTCLPAIVC